MLVEQVADIITPLIAAIAGQPNFASLTFTIHRYLQSSAIDNCCCSPDPDKACYVLQVQICLWRPDQQGIDVPVYLFDSLLCCGLAR